MTIFVDDMFLAATVGRHDSQWCHLVTDAYDPAELHAFAAKLGLRRSYFQWKAKPQWARITKSEADPPWQWHYDVTIPKRMLAVRLGATEIDGAGLVEIMDAKRTLFKALTEAQQAEQRALWARVAKGLATFPRYDTDQGALF